MKKITKKGETENLVISDSTFEESSELQKICNSWDDKNFIDGEEFESNYIEKCLTEGDLPPVINATKDNYQLKSIYKKSNNKLIGLTDIYYGFPSDDRVWISLFIIDKDYRNEGIGQEVVDFISVECTKSGYKSIGIGVNLKNWTALRFWVNSGFDRVTGVFGDKVYSEETYSLVGLSKPLIMK